MPVWGTGLCRWFFLGPGGTGHDDPHARGDAYSRDDVQPNPGGTRDFQRCSATVGNASTRRCPDLRTGIHSTVRKRHSPRRGTAPRGPSRLSSSHTAQLSKLRGTARTPCRATYDFTVSGMVSLVVMAAGLGSRFGGTKQLAVVGADGEAFVDFAIRDAVDAGVGRVVLIVRSDIKDDVRRHIGDRYGDLEISYVCQDEHGPPRSKPWGTAHAVLAAASEVDGSFVVCNADDYYGRSTYESVVARTSGLKAGRALLGGFRLELTLPEIGEVSRAFAPSRATNLRRWLKLMASADSKTDR